MAYIGSIESSQSKPSTQRSVQYDAQAQPTHKPPSTLHNPSIPVHPPTSPHLTAPHQISKSPNLHLSKDTNPHNTPTHSHLIPSAHTLNPNQAFFPTRRYPTSSATDSRHVRCRTYVQSPDHRAPRPTRVQTLIL